MIRGFNADESRIVAQLQEDCSVGAWLIPVGFRAGLTCGVRRALAVIEGTYGQAAAIAAIRKLLEDE